MNEYEVASEPVLIAAPGTLVWNVLIDLPGYVHWNPLNRRVESTLRIGDPVSLWISDPDLAKAGAVFVHRLLALEPETHIAWGFESGGPPAFSARRDQYVTVLSPGSCTYHTTDRFFGPGAKALMDAYGADVRRSFDLLSDALRLYCESRHAR